jgi:hypothetical protein
MLSAPSAQTAAGETEKPQSAPKTYAETRDFLRRRTKVFELAGEGGTRATVCPEYQGRIMTSSFGGADGPGLGWVNYDFIAAGKHSPPFNNYGGEDRFWLGPEGGQFSLFFELGLSQTVQNWFTPPELNTGAFKVESVGTGECRLSRRLRVTNAAKSSFDVRIDRTLQMLGAKHFAEFFGAGAARALRETQSPFVAFQSANTMTNVGRTAWDRKNGLVSIWTLGQFPAGDRTVIIVPYKEGSESELGPVVQSDYFGSVPPERLRITREAILFRGDGQFRAKLGVSPKRAKPFAGSVDLRTGILTLVHFSMPENPAAHFYVNNAWKLYVNTTLTEQQYHSLEGDVLNTYNDGPPEPGAKSLGSFYELETLSPTRPLAKGERIVHHHRTFHLWAEPDALARLVKETLGVELDEVRRFVD